MKPLLIIFLLVTSSHAFAGDQSGVVQKLFVSGRDYAPPFQNPSHVSMDGNYNDRPACATSGYWAINTETEQGKALLTLLITSSATGKSITLYGTGSCSLRPDMETVFQVGFGD
ncbi:MAG: hypothetical protein WBN96_15320 [Gammaproteobacteria bacterium]